MRRRPLPGIEQRLGQRDVGVRISVPFAQRRLAVHQLQHFHRDPSATKPLVLVEPQVDVSARSALEQPHEQQILAIDPELLGERVATRGADDVHRSSLPGALVESRQVEPEPAQLRFGTRRALGIDVEAEHEQLVEARVGAHQLAAGDREDRIAGEQRARFRVEIGIDAQAPGQRRRFIPGLRDLAAVRAIQRRLLHERQRAIPRRIAVVHGAHERRAAGDRDRRGARRRGRRGRCGRARRRLFVAGADQKDRAERARSKEARGLEELRKRCEQDHNFEIRSARTDCNSSALLAGA